jgi:HSP20 family protein
MADTKNKLNEGSASQTDAQPKNTDGTQSAATPSQEMGVERSRSREGETGIIRNRDMGLRPWGSNPFDTIRHMSQQMDRLMQRFGFGRGVPSLGSSLFNDYDSLLGEMNREGMTLWNPDVEMVQREGELIVRADVPGLKKEDLHVEVRNDSIVIEGERRDQTEEDRSGYHYSDRRYGKFHREIPLPEGVKSEQAKASFREAGEGVIP